jgi:hypothetical protein
MVHLTDWESMSVMSDHFDRGRTGINLDILYHSICFDYVELCSNVCFYSTAQPNQVYPSMTGSYPALRVQSYLSESTMGQREIDILYIII